MGSLFYIFVSLPLLVMFGAFVFHLWDQWPHYMLVLEEKKIDRKRKREELERYRKQHRL